MDAVRLRSLVGKRVLFQFDSGSQVVGTLARCLPDLGAVHLVEVEGASLISREGVLLRELPSYPFIPATPVSATEV
ncbi:MAG: hypothetical protein JXB32_03445 [Deltaproteobacteria bacterium]|nr:hypothetical protein [Deltaproteobacteria bacterium]